MSLAVVYTRANAGMDAPLVTVETHLSNGLPSLAIVGLPETAVRESRERVRSAILNTGMEFPARRITINLAPADLPKVGGRFDLAIALSILAASGQLPLESLANCEILGELALTGALRPVEGVLPAVLAARESSHTLLLPAANAEEAELVRDNNAFSASHLEEVCRHLSGRGEMPPCRFRPERLAASRPAPDPDLSSIKGQGQAKRALEIAAAGGHNLLLVGPPGTGKTLLANALYGLLPALSEAEALEMAAVRSVAGCRPADASWTQPPLRAPHHSASAVALVGGGRTARPGEVTLAHKGLLFLDELTEFSRHVLECLREPLESGVITISRASYRTEFPAQVQLVAAMNPCPCGYHGDPLGQCKCTPERIERYLEKISGPLLDRIDLQIQVPRLEEGELFRQEQAPASDSEQVSARVQSCRERQLQRSGVLNNALRVADLERVCVLESSAQSLLEAMMARMHLSARACHRILKVARTVADLRAARDISESDIAEAVACRQFNR